MVSPGLLAEGEEMAITTLERPDEDGMQIRAVLFGNPLNTAANVSVSFRHLQCRLPRALDLMRKSRSRWILILETPSEHYIQFLATENGVLVSECVSNEYLEARPLQFRLTADAELHLQVFGWKPPELPKQPNWQTVGEGQKAAVDAAVIALRTFRRIFDCQDEDALNLQFFKST
jgi:hypothetical protein